MKKKYSTPQEVVVTLKTPVVLFSTSGVHGNLGDYESETQLSRDYYFDDSDVEW